MVPYVFELKKEIVSGSGFILFVELMKNRFISSGSFSSSGMSEMFDLL